MSIKHLFDKVHIDKSTAGTNSDQLGGEVESERFHSAKIAKDDRIIPQVDFSKPENFVFYGSAERYYDDAIKNIYQTYPYDGSLYEKLDWENSASYIDLYVFENLYPRTNGYIRFDRDGADSSTSIVSDYGIFNSADQEYITIKGGPGIGGGPQNAGANIYNTGSFQESNLKLDPVEGTTVEFWLKKKAFNTSRTKKEVLFDLWNGEHSSSSGYGRLTIELTGATYSQATTTSGRSFRVTYQSGNLADAGAPTHGFQNESIGTVGTLTSSVADNTWHHYAFSFLSASNGVKTRLYVDGDLNEEKILGSNGAREITGSLIARIGALRTAPSGAVGAHGSTALDGAGKLSGSLDEFRYWKTQRSSKEIGRHWFTQVGGGTNTDTANTKLGVYYKFNEGILGNSTDATVLDYSGRVTNGAWTGYIAGARETGSAINEATSTNQEFLDPILYRNHSSVNSLISRMRLSGSSFDHTNTTSLFSSLPSWMQEEDQKSGDLLLDLTQIMSSYFDSVQLQISELPKLKDVEYISGSSKPNNFNSTLLSSMGFLAPEIFIDAEIIENLAARSEDRKYEKSLEHTKNLIYKNIYNNLSYIYKSKGTEKSFRNLIRCFGIDDDIIKLSTYGNNVTHKFRNNYRVVSTPKKYVNFNDNGNFEGTVFQMSSSKNSNSLPYIDAAKQLTGGYGFTLQTEVVLPKKANTGDSFYSRQRYTDLTASLFGVHTARTSSTNTSNTQWAEPDVVNFQVHAVRDEAESDNVRFVLTGSGDGYFPELSSSLFEGAYDNTKWNLAVRVKPAKFPHVDSIHGTTGSNSGADINYSRYYTVELYGNQTDAGSIQNEFTVTGNIDLQQLSPGTSADQFIYGARRIYMGAHRTNFTGAVLQRTDAKISSCRFWLDYLDDETLRAHARDVNNHGAKNPYRNAYLFEGKSIYNDSRELVGRGRNFEVPQIETLALNWDFNQVTGSNAAGEFNVVDFSSGSVEKKKRYGWIGDITKAQYTARGYGFATSSIKVIDKEYITSARQNMPENMQSEDMISVLSTQDDIQFTRDTRPINYFFAFEKSMYQTISEEMLNIFASIVDFNNLIGEPVNKYRHEYKQLNKLRSLFFERVQNTPDLDKYVEFYKWFDDALSKMLEQMIPASADFSDEIRTVVESHILERSKYQHKFPTLEMKTNEIIGSAENVLPLSPGWAKTHHPVSGDEADNANWWKTRAERHDVISSSAGIAVNSAKNQILRVVKSVIDRKKTTPYRFSQVQRRTIHGGINYHQNKRRDIIYNSVYPFGPILSGTNVPLNIAITFQSDLDALPQIDHLDPNQKRYMSSRMTLSRNQEDGAHYTLKGDMVALYNLVSSSRGTAPEAGYNKHVVRALTGANVPAGQIELVNLHSDTVGESNEIPMQGPFTEKYVGGRQHRHIDINRVSSTKSGKNNLDSKADRPEGWRLLLDCCSDEDETGAIAFVGPQYPDDGVGGPLGSPPYLIDRPKAHLYREVAAKRPINIRNIRQTTGSPTIIGNYSHNYEVVHTVGRTHNDPFFRDQSVQFAPSAEIPFLRRGSKNKTGSVGYRNPLGLVDVQKETPPKEQLNYRLPTRTTNKTVIVNRFSSPGGFEVMSRGYLDPAHEELSPYNALPYRNLGIRGSGSGEAGDQLRANDHTGRRRGLQTLLKQRSGQFGHDADFGSVNALQYVTTPAYHKVHRNRRLVPKLASPTDDQSFITGSRYDNAYVTHVIPQSDMQYRWITASALSVASNKLLGFAQLSGGIAPSTDILFLSASQFVSYTSSAGQRFFGSEDDDLEATSGAQRTVWTDFAGINFHIYEPLTASTGHLGYISTAPATTYANVDILDAHRDLDTAVTSGSMLNALLLHRNGPYQYPSWKQVRTGQHPVARYQRRNNILTIRTQPETIETTSGGKTKTIQGLGGNSFITYVEPAVSNESKPLVHIFKSRLTGSDVSRSRRQTIKMAHSYTNNLTYFANIELNNKLGTIKDSDTDSMLNRVNKVLFDPNTDSPLDSSESIRFIYSERIFPRRKNSPGFNKIRTRENFSIANYWAADRTSRARANPLPIFSGSLSTVTGALPPKVGLLSQSIWPLDAEHDGTSMLSNARTPGKGGPGLLQNNYTTYHTASTYAPLKQYGPLYCRRTPASIWVPYHESSASFFPGATVWEAATQAGKQPFQAYEDFSEHLRLVGKDYSIIPEFRMSEHLDYYINEKRGDFLADRNSVLEITGATIADSSNEDFYSVYAHTDFMKYFETVDEQYHEKTLTDGTEISRDRIALKCSALLKFLPYDGFYPVQRTVELSKLFFKDFVSGSDAKGEGARLLSTQLALKSTARRNSISPAVTLNSSRPYVEPFFAPGIMYNTIKSGIAVDYPVAISTMVTASLRRHTLHGTSNTDQWYVSASVGVGVDKHFHRVPFEAIIKPSSYVNQGTISGSIIFDMEPHPSGNLAEKGAPFPNVVVTREGGGKLYELAAENFFAECLNFFMKEDEEKSLLTTFASKPESDFGTVVSGNLYSMRVNLDRAPIALFGRNSAGAAANSNPGFYSINENTFNMYDRPSAFGPAFCAHRTVTGSAIEEQKTFAYQPVTPSYYDGKSSALIVYRPDTTGRPTLDDIFAKSKIICQRSFAERADGKYVAYSDTDGTVVEYEHSLSQLLAMQITSSVDILKSETIPIPDSDQVSKRWIIQPKFETPILNFDNSVDVNIPSGLNLLESDYSNDSANNRHIRQYSKGMWHQYGKVPTGSAGVWLSLTTDSKISDPTVEAQLAGTYSDSNSLADVVGMPLRRDRIGEVKTSKIISEAVVAVPFLEKRGQKVFFNISRSDIDAALEGFDGVGDTIQNMVDMMQKYVLPPKFDFIKNATIQPFAMYMFEFSAELTQKDLTDIWQNLPPDLSDRFENKEAVIEHDLLANEFYGLEGQDLDGSLKWLVFKAKRQAEKSYFNLRKGITAYNAVEDGKELGDLSNLFKNRKNKPRLVKLGQRNINLSRRPAAKVSRTRLSKVGTLMSGRSKVDLTEERVPKYSYNWPYDYFSLVELIKIDAAVQYATEERDENPMIPIPSEGER